MENYTIIYKTPFINGFKLTKLEFLAFQEMLNATSPADKLAQEGGHLLILSSEFEKQLKNNINVSEGVARSAMTKLVKNKVYRKVKGVAHIYQLNPKYYGKVYNSEDQSDIIALREKNLFTK